MVTTNRIIKYPLNAERVLLYDKKTRQSFSLPKAEYEVLVENGTLESVLSTKSTEVINSNVNSLFTKKIFYFDRFTLKGRIGAVFETLVIYCAVPSFVLSLLLCDAGIPSITSLRSLVYFALGFILAFPIGLLLHEYAHAVVANNNGAFVPELGIGFRRSTVFYAYTRVVGIDYIQNTYKKGKIYFAGIGANFLLAAIALFLISCLQLSSTFYLSFVIVFSLQAFFNLSTYTNGDGYSILRLVLPDCNLPEEFTFAFLKKMLNNSEKWILWFPIVNFTTSVVLPAILILFGWIL